MMKNKELLPVLPTDAAQRNEYPMADGLLDYFPLALAEVSRLSKVGNQQHNPGEPMHWARDKSTDHANKIIKHVADRGLVDTDGIRHSVKAAWRALAMAQEELEAAGANPGRASKFPEKPGQIREYEPFDAQRNVRQLQELSKGLTGTGRTI